MSSISTSGRPKRNNEHPAKNDNQTTPQTKRARYQTRSVTRSDKRELGLFGLNSEKQNEMPQPGPKTPKIKQAGSRDIAEESSAAASSSHIPDNATAPWRSLPLEIWNNIVAYLTRPLGNNWPYKLLDNLADPYLDVDREWLLARRALCSLCLTSKEWYELAIGPLYHSICLQSERSAVLLFRTLLSQQSKQHICRELIVIGPMAEYKCCEMFAAQTWPKKAFSTNQALNQWKSWKSENFQPVESLDPTVATAVMAEIFHMSPHLEALAVMDAFISHDMAYEKLKTALLKIQENKGEAHMLPNLSTLIILGNSASNNINPTFVKDWAGLFQPYSGLGIETIHLAQAHLDPSFVLPSSIKTLKLSYTRCEALPLNGTENLTSLDIYPGTAAGTNFKRQILQIPLGLTRLRLNTGYYGFCMDVPDALNLPILSQLKYLQVPMALLFEDPDVMVNKKGSDVFPLSLLSLELLEVWSQHSRCKYNVDSYGDKMADFLENTFQGLPSLSLLEFREQWPHVTRSFEARGNKPPRVNIARLFSNSSGFLCKRASFYKYLNAPYALRLVSKAVTLDPNNRKALICQAQIQASLGQPEKAVETLKRINPPAQACFSKPIQNLLGFVHMARRYLREDAEKALWALRQALHFMVAEEDAPREWILMLSEANLLLSRPNQAIAIVEGLLKKNNEDVQALLIVGRAYLKLREDNDDDTDMSDGSGDGDDSDRTEDIW
jgi:tetratricopeptide (TPR) repeat protein